ncbi:uncharacterized protein cubi_01996 [Cryptosporidium ubiquitum]|uniref:Uncharacterized protein n=1 Tax=Cryptosporidium ubiquitum TaxID=857276 RepID=A0A1J4MPV7_9CRYT|nr:uncharacterized protein cubi_01996 [Cryptosporidium ubiquitum]OII75475.1 hypothetical protein cubi_01996 [Cryptosporidium ubiquitum]
MISSLENGPTEEDLELLLGGCNKEEQLLFVDLREEPDDFEETNYQENFNNLNSGDYIERNDNKKNQYEAGKLRKHRAKPKKTRPKRKRNQFKDNSDRISIDSDEFVVPDDEIIPPDWEYNYEKPIVCQNVTFYNKVDNILTSKFENVGNFNNNGKECNCSEDLDEDLDEDLINNLVINRSGLKTKKYQIKMSGIDIDKDYIDDKDNTALIVESHMVKDNLDDEEQVIYVDKKLDSFLKQTDQSKVINKIKSDDSELIIDKSDDLIMNTETLNFGILNIYFKIMSIFEGFEKYNKSQDYIENSLNLEENDISTLLIIFKSIDIEFSNFSNNKNSCNSNNNSSSSSGNFDLIQIYLDLFYKNILNLFSKVQNFNSAFLKELHFEMIGFLESKYEEVINLDSSKLDNKAIFLFLRVIGLTLFFEHLLIRSIKIEKSSESKVQNMNEIVPVFFGNENILNKNNVSKILRQILKKMLDHLLDLALKDNLKDKMNDFQCILILTLFFNFKLSGDLIFTIISEKYHKESNLNSEIFLFYYYAMIVYSNITDLKFDISKLFAKFIFEFKNKSSSKKDCLSHYYLLNEYLKTVSVYQINNINCGNKFESLLYWLSDSNFLYNVNKKNEMNIFLSIINDKESNLEIFYSNIHLSYSKLKEIYHKISCLEGKFKRILFLDFGQNDDSTFTEITGGIILQDDIKKIDIFELTEEIYFYLFNLLINFMKNSKELNLLLKFIHIHFDFEKASNICKNDITMHYLVYNSLFTALLANSKKFEFEIPILDLYEIYLDENDKINNYLLTEMVLNCNNTEDNHFIKKIQLNKNYKLLIQTLLGSSKFGPHFEINFHIDIIYNIITLIESLDEKNSKFDYLRDINKLKLNDLLGFNSNKIIPKNNFNKYSLNSNELFLHSLLISKFNSNALFTHTINTGTKLSLTLKKNNTCKIHVDNNNNSNNKLHNIENELIKVMIYFKIIIEEILDIYFDSIYKISDDKLNQKNIDFIDEIFNLINNLSIFLVWNLFELNDSTVCNFLRYFFGLISDKLLYYTKYFKNNKNNGGQICELFIFHTFRNLGEFILKFFDKFNQNITLKCEIYSFMIVLYLLMFNIKHFSLKYHYIEYFKLEKKVFEKIQILNNNDIFDISKIKSKKKIVGKLKNNNLINYYIKKRVCNNLSSIYKLVGVISNLWKSKIKTILDYIEFYDSSDNESLNSESKTFNINGLILELYFYYYISYLDNEVLQIINKKAITNSINLYSSNNIFGLLINFILKGISENHINKNTTTMELILNWNHINNSVKGYINQLKNDLLINIWINYDFIQMIMIPSSFSCRFIYMRINFWVNILSIPLSKMLINCNEDFNNVRITLEYPLKYFKKLIILKDIDVIEENLVNFSINFIIDSVRLIHLSYFKIVLKMLISKIQNTEKYHLEHEELTKLILNLLNYMTVISQKIKIEFDSNQINSKFEIDDNIKSDILDIISLIISYLNQVSKVVHDILINKKELIHNYYSNSFDGKTFYQINYESLKKKTEWINYFIYSSNLNYSNNSESQEKYNILEYILKNSDRYSLSVEFQKLPKIFQYIKKKTSKRITYKF